MKIPKIPLAQSIVQLCKAKEIKHIVISPGSRNAPLTIGFTNDSYFTCYSIVDERCAAFFALGIAQQIHCPVVLVCTSGSALLNYFPAVAEAFYSEIPLVVLSADRPKYLVGIGDGQTIDQKDVYGTHVLYSANLKQDIDETKESLIEKNEALPIFKNIETSLGKRLGMQQSIQQENETKINKALNAALNLNGPVHINCPFDEPLYETVDAYSVTIKNTKVSKVVGSLENEELKSLISTWNSSQRKMILVGVNPPNQIDDDILEQLAKDESLIVFKETTSNLHHDAFFPSIDAIIMPLDSDDFEMLKPDLLITFGGMVVSKKVKAFLRKYRPKHHWHVGDTRANDTFFCLNKQINGTTNSFFSKILADCKSHSSGYRSHWNAIKTIRKAKHNAYLEAIPFSDFKVFNAVLRSIPNKSHLHLGNSSTVRYSQLFDLNLSLNVFCNRGTSGIDGSTSTAIGAATVSEAQSIFITGDLSFFYDSNALWNNYIPSNFRIVVINNGGGGIFRILPGENDSEQFDTYFETIHDLNAKQLCSMYNFDYEIALTEDELEVKLPDFYSNSGRPKLLEIFTPRKDNDKILLDYFRFIK